MDSLRIITKLGDNKEIVTGFTTQDGIVLPREVILSLLRHAFKLVEDDTYRYSEDPETSRIAIEDAAVFDDFSSINIKPVITVARTASNFMGLVLGDKAYFGAAGSGVTGLASNLSGTDIMVGGMNINIYSPLGLEAEKIGWLIFMLLKVYKPQIEKNYFHDFKVIGISPIMRAGSTLDISFVTININYAIEQEWISNSLGGIFGDSWNNCIRFKLEFSASTGDGENCNITKKNEWFKNRRI